MQYLTLNLPGGNLNNVTSIPQGGFTELTKILNNSITVFMIAGLIFATIYIVWGGLQWITSQGDKAKVTAARGRITWAIIGFILLLLSILIIKTIGNFFQINLLQLIP